MMGIVTSYRFRDLGTIRALCVWIINNERISYAPALEHCIVVGIEPRLGSG